MTGVIRDALVRPEPRPATAIDRPHVRAREHVVVALSGASIKVRSVWVTRALVKTVLRTGSTQ